MNDSRSPVPPNVEAYNRGDALHEALHPESTLERPLSLSDLLDNAAAWDLEPDEYWAWVAHLLRAGRDLDRELNDVLHETYRCGTAFYNIQSWRRLHRLLRKLYTLQPQLRDLERDVNELTLVMAADSPTAPRHSDGDAFTSVMLESAQTSYDRAYQLCQNKLTRIQQGWITATNLVISLIMLVVTILFWQEFT